MVFEKFDSEKTGPNGLRGTNVYSVAGRVGDGVLRKVRENLNF